MAWFKRFYDPIILPDGRKLLTYRDAAEYITALPKAERDAADWQVAMETLLLVAERNGPEMLAADRDDAGAEQAREANVGTAHEACESLQDRQMTTVWVYVDTSQQVGAPDHLKVFASRDAADAWFAKDDPEVIAFEHDVIEGPWLHFQTENI